MRMTESRLRRIIRQVIRESSGGSHKWYTEWTEATEKIQGSLKKHTVDCLRDFGVGMVAADHFGDVVKVITSFHKEGISESELTSILSDIESVPSKDDLEGSKLLLMFTATIKLLIEKGKLKVDLDYLKKKGGSKGLASQMKPGDMLMVAAKSASQGDRLSSCLIYVKESERTSVDSTDYYVIDQNYFSMSGIYDRDKHAARRKEDEKEHADYLKRSEEAEQKRKDKELPWYEYTR